MVASNLIQLNAFWEIKSQKSKVKIQTEIVALCWAVVFETSLGILLL